MSQQELEKRLRQAFERATPDLSEQLMRECADSPTQIVLVPAPKSPRPLVRRFTGLAAALLLMIGAGSGVQYYRTNLAVASSVSLDVNPSIEIQVNRKERVLAVRALNADGTTVIGDMDFSGSTLDVTVNALVGSLLRHGYLSELANSILISVDGSASAQTLGLQNKLTQEINSLLQTDRFTGAVLSQTVTNTDSLQAQADTYGITLGKAQLIQSILAQNPLYTFDRLAPLTINELNLLRSSSPSPAGTKIESVGTASDKAYLGAERAQQVAYSHAGVAAADAVSKKTELEYDDGRMRYEVEFSANGIRYEYELDATTGEILQSERKGTNGHEDEHAPPRAARSQPRQTKTSAPTRSDAVPSPVANTLDTAAALRIAYAHAGVSASQVQDAECEYDEEARAYEIEFKSGHAEYDYRVDAKNGSILTHNAQVED